MNDLILFDGLPSCKYVNMSQNNVSSQTVIKKLFPSLSFKNQLAFFLVYIRYVYFENI